MLHSLLKRQLHEIGIDNPDQPPDAETWRRFLARVSDTYDQSDDRLIYSALFDQTNDAVFILDLNGKHLTANLRAAEMLGYTPVELVGMSFTDVVEPSEHAYSDRIRQALLAGETIPPYERVFRAKDGTHVPVEINAQLIRDSLGQPLYIQSVCRDITERKRNEAAARARETLYRTLVKNIPNTVVLMFNRDLRYVLAEGVIFERGHTRADFEGRTLWEALPPDRAEFYLPYYRAALDGQESRFEAEDGGGVYQLHIVPVRDENGNIIGGMSISQDITERKRAEEVMRFQAALVDHMHDAVITTDNNYRITTWNAGAERMYGWSAAEVIGRDANEIVGSHLTDEERAAANRALAETGHWENEVVHLHRDGHRLDILASVSLLRDKDGRPAGLIGIDRDITARKEVERALAHEHDLLQALLDNFPDLIYFKDAESRFIRVNKAHAIRLGCADPAETLGKTDFDYFPPDVAAQFRAEEQRIIETGEPVINRLEYDTTPDGKPRWLSATKVPVFGSDGKPHTIVGISRDITAIKQAEEAIRYQATLVDHISDAVYSTDLDENILTWNRGAERMYGWRADEAIGQWAGKVVGSSMSLEERRVVIQQILDTGQWAGEVSHLSRAGRPIHVWVSVALLADGVGHPTGFIAVCRDITEQHQAQEKQRQSEEKYRQLFNATQWQAQELTLLNRARAAVAQEMDLASVIRTIVRTIAEIFNYAYVSLYLLEGDRLILYHQIGYDQPVPVIPLNKGIIGRTARIGEPVFVEHIADDPDYLAAADGITAEICVPLFDRDRVVGVFNIESTVEKKLTNDDMRLMIALSEQISIAVERARLYTSLRESKEQYQAVLSSVREVIFQTDDRGYWTFLNPAWTEITGYRVEESLGSAPMEVIHPDDRELNRTQYRRLIAGEIPFARYETRIVMKDGTNRWIEVHVHSTADSDGRVLGLSGTLTDITERKRSEQQAAELLAQSRTVDALRHFLSNVTHDLRTPLSIMNTSLYLLRRKLVEADIAVRHVDVLQEQVAHLTHIVEDLVEMTRLEDQVVEFEFIPVHLGNLVRDVMVSYETIARDRRLALRYDSDPNIPMIQADQSWIGRLVHNLITNAVQYTPDGGAISLRTCASDGGVLLEVQDTGIGISPADLPYIFDRFYRADTARPADKGGAGLGLAIVRKVVDAHDGWVKAESLAGQGSTFRVWLPISRPTAQERSLKGA